MLIVDDDPFIRKLIVTTLEGVSEFDLHEAGDGVEAVEIAGRQSPRLVFLDIDMPRMDGIEACRAMRADAGDGRREDRHADRRPPRTPRACAPRRPAPTSS